MESNAQSKRDDKYQFCLSVCVFMCVHVNGLIPEQKKKTKNKYPNILLHSSVHTIPQRINKTDVQQSVRV